MSFWTTSEGESLKENNSGEFDAGGGDMEPIPKGTDVLAAIDEAKVDEKDGAEYISLRWTVLKPAAYLGRKVFQKVWAFDHDSSAKDPAKKKDKALRMLSAIDANAGGKLVASGQKPDNDSLQMYLMNMPMVLKLGLWEMKKDDGSDMSGNWVMQVAPKSKGVAEVTVTPKPSAGGGSQEMDDTEIPF